MPTKPSDDETPATVATDTVTTPGAAAPSSPKASTPSDAPNNRLFWMRMDSPFVGGFLLTLGGLAALVLGLALRDLSTVLIYIVLALFLSLGLDPVVQWLHRRGLGRTASIVTTVIGAIVVFAGVLWLIIPTVISQVSQFVQSVPGLVRDFTQSDLFNTLENTFGEGFETLINDAQKFITNPSNIAAIGGGALQVGASIFTGISGIVIVIALTLYFVATLPTIKASFTRLLPARNRPRAESLTDQITASIGGYLGGMVVLALCNAVFALIMHIVIGLPFPMLMAVVAFCVTLIPLIGSVMFWGIASVLALFTSPIAALIFAVAYLVYMQVESYVLTPRVMSRTVSVPGSLVVIGALVGGTLLGLLGALVAIPVTASILLIIRQVWVPKQDARV